MNKYLKSASNNFEKIKQKDYLISPISEIDCEIIVEIVELFKKANISNVVEVLKNYKFLKDEEIRDQLLDCNTNFKQYSVENDFDEDLDEDNPDSLKSKAHLINTIKKLKELLDKKIEFITINEDRINSHLIFGFTIKEEYNEDECYVGKLILNPTDKLATKIPLYANYELTFYDEDKLQSTVEFLEKQLEKANIKFINKEIAEKENTQEDDSGILNGESDSDQDD